MQIPISGVERDVFGCLFAIERPKPKSMKERINFLSFHAMSMEQAGTISDSDRNHWWLRHK